MTSNLNALNMLTANQSNLKCQGQATLTDCTNQCGGVINYNFSNGHSTLNTKNYFTFTTLEAFAFLGAY